MTAAAAIRPAPATAGRAVSAAPTAAMASAAVSASLWAPPTSWTSTIGLRATKATAVAGTTPRRAASRATIHAVTATANPARSFSDQSAKPTPIAASG